LNRIGRKKDKNFHLSSGDRGKNGDFVIRINHLASLKKVAIFAEAAGGLKGEKSGVTAGKEMPKLIFGQGFGRVQGILGNTDG
jgi:hypothetical protein